MVRERLTTSTAEGTFDELVQDLGFSPSESE